MYFGRGLHAEDENAGARASQFTGQSSISSAQYFGHPEEDQGFDGSGGHGAGHLGRAPSSGILFLLLHSSCFSVLKWVNQTHWRQSAGRHKILREVLSLKRDRITAP